MTSTTTRAPATFADLPALMSMMTGDDKHDQAATSTLDVLWVLYDRVLRVSPDTADEDRGTASCCPRAMGRRRTTPCSPPKDSWTPVSCPASVRSARLGHHPDRMLVPGAEISSGSLGHGLPLAVGMALGLRARGLAGPRVFVLLGDAELDEGVQPRGDRVRPGRPKLDSLTAVVVDNASSTHGWPGGVEAGSRSRAGRCGAVARPRP